MHRITLAIVIFVSAPALGIFDTIFRLNPLLGAENHSTEPLPGATADIDLQSDESISIVNAGSYGSTVSTASPTTLCEPQHDVPDRLWLINTRHLSSQACTAPLTSPAFRVSQLSLRGRQTHVGIDGFLSTIDVSRPLIIQVHGNRMSEQDALERGFFVYNNTVTYLKERPIDFMIFSWPSDKEGLLAQDGREKAARTDAEGLYLAWLLRELVDRDVTVEIIGFSFGGRIATGALHALAGGQLGGRTLPGTHRQGAEVKLGLIAPALEDDWLRVGNYHGLASQNIHRMSILYNQRDAVLKRYWLIDKVRGSRALGYTGPKGLGPRIDGSPVPVYSRDCSPTLGIVHDEKKYYTQDCRAGMQMAKLLNSPH